MDALVKEVCVDALVKEVCVDALVKEVCVDVLVMEGDEATSLEFLPGIALTHLSDVSPPFTAIVAGKRRAVVASVGRGGMGRVWSRNRSRGVGGGWGGSRGRGGGACWVIGRGRGGCRIIGSSDGGVRGRGEGELRGGLCSHRQNRQRDGQEGELRRKK